MIFRNIAKFWAGIPGRRRRQWRYVSPRRRWVALLTLAAMLLLIYGYWYGTNDRKVGRMAEDYLHDFTGGCKVRIHKAHFGLFSGLQLEGVRISQKDSSKPLLEARGITMRLRPWDLLSGRIRPVDVVCDQPTLTWYETPDETTNAGKFIAGNQQSLSDDVAAWRGELPTIIIREGTLKMISQDGINQEPVRMNISLLPAGPVAYHIMFEKLRRNNAEQVTGSLDYDIKTGQISNAKGYIPEMADLGSALPETYRQWLGRYSVRGASAIRQIAGAEKPGIYEFEMLGLSLKLPDDQGGLSLADVRGKLRFSVAGVDMENITGNIVQAGGAKFQIEKGRYDGYELDSPFNISLTVTDFLLPKAADISGALSPILQDINEGYQLTGKFSVSMTMERLAGEDISFRGKVRPGGMSGRFRPFPYPLDDIRGELTFNDGQVKIDGLTASRGATKVQITGLIGRGWQSYEVVCKATNVGFDKTLHDALPKKFQDFWTILGPGGGVGCELNISRQVGQTEDHIKTRVIADGKASLTYNAFPYRIENLTGDVNVDGDDVTIDMLQGRRGNMRCTVSGKILRASAKDTDMDITVSARRFALDEALMAALPEMSRSLLRDANAAGEADRVVAKITQDKGGELVHDVEVTAAGMSYNHNAFPYAVTDVAGSLNIHQNRITLKDLKGRHDDSPVTINGLVMLGETQGVDLKIQAGNVPLDKDLNDSLPPQAKQAWAQLTPQGRADLELVYRQNLPELKQPMDYSLTLRARNMAIQYTEFPYPFTGLNGTAVITPGRIELKGLKSVRNKMQISADGTIVYDDKTHIVDLAVKATDLPVDQQLLGAWPKDTLPLVSMLKPGGRCDLDLSRLRFTRQIGDVTSTPASKPSASPVTWDIQGKIALSDGLLDVGFGNMTVTGAFSGSASSDKIGLTIAAGADLKKLEMNDQVITELSAKITKSPRGLIVHVEDLAGEMMGGRLAGGAEVQLSAPMECWVMAQVNDLKLSEIFAAAMKKKPPKDLKIDGTLAGNIRLRSKVGDKTSQQAVGELWISKARITQMPVMLGSEQVLLPLPGEGAYTDGLVRYELKGSKLTFNEINLSGSSLSIVGSGSLNMKTDALRLNFVGKPGGSLPRIDSLDVMLEPIIRELTEIRVTGTAQKPLVRNSPLKSINDISRRLNNPTQDAE